MALPPVKIVKTSKDFSFLENSYGEKGNQSEMSFLAFIAVRKEKRKTDRKISLNDEVGKIQFRFFFFLSPSVRSANMEGKEYFHPRFGNKKIFQSCASAKIMIFFVSFLFYINDEVFFPNGVICIFKKRLN